MGDAKRFLREQIERRSTNMMIRILQSFESNFPDLDKQEKGGVFKFHVRNIVNDAMRATRDQLSEFEIRQLHKANMTLVGGLLNTIEEVVFQDKRIMFCVPTSQYKVLEKLRDAIGYGVIYKDNGEYILEVVGTRDCANSVLPIMDQYINMLPYREDYVIWRNSIISSYLGDRNGSEDL